MPSQLSQYALYAAAAISAAAVPGHTQMGFELVFPSLRTVRAGPKDHGAVSAKIGWLEGNQVFAIMAILYTKWAKYGITDSYERAILLFTVTYQIACGIGFARNGIYKPLLALWLGPGLGAISQLL